MYLSNQVEVNSSNVRKQTNEVIPSPSQPSAPELLLNSVQCDHDCWAYTDRLKRYCHSSLFNEQEGTSSHEGRLKDDGYELVHVHLIARHGDRTPVSDLVLGEPVHYECGLVDNSFNWDGLDDFNTHFLATSSSGHDPLIQLNPGRQSKKCEDVKGMGKLTALGFKQHALLGKLLREKYNDFVSDFIDNVQSLKKSVFLQSTQIVRTIHSLSAFMLGFLSDSIQLRQAATIHVSRGTLLQLPPIGISRVYKQCHGYTQLWDEDRIQTGFLATENEQRFLITKLCRMFGLVQKCQRLSVSKVFEQLSIRGCHNPSHPLPCLREDGPCVPYSQALELFQYADWVWANGHPLMSSIIATMPLLNHSVLTPMERIMDSFQQHNSLPGSYRFMVSLTHDDTITKLLTNLGVGVREWIPYATRIVFELWRKKTTNEYKVRILLNGEVVTEQIECWSEGMNRELVPYIALKEFLLSGKYRNLMSYNKICRTI